MKQMQDSRNSSNNSMTHSTTNDSMTEQSPPPQQQQQQQCVGMRVRTPRTGDSAEQGTAQVYAR